MSNESKPVYPLAGVRVLDFTKLLAGPLCTQYLADLGAEVIKVEDCDRGDDSRTIGPFRAGEGSWFFGVNRNKRSVALDLKHTSSRPVLERLIDWADVVVESFGGGVAERLGLGHERLMERKASLVYCSISAYGRSGPSAALPGYEVMMQAFAGMMVITGDPDGGPARTAFSPLDQTTGIHAATGILAALRHRDQTGQGLRVEASLFETAASFMALHAQDYWMTGKLPQRQGSGMAVMVPYQAFTALDGDMVLAVGNDKLWRKFCQTVGQEPLIDDARFATNSDRVANRQATVETVAAVLAKREVAHWEEVLGRAGVPCARINTLERMYEHPQAQARGIVMHYEHPRAGAMKAVACPANIHGVPREVRRPPPAHGEHTAEVLRDLGFTDAEIDRLETDHAVRVPQPQPA